MMTQIMEVKVAEPKATCRLAKDSTDMHTAVRRSVRIREYPRAIMLSELGREDRFRRLAQDHRPWSGLGPRQQDNALFQIDLLSPQAEELAPAHQGQRCEFHDCPNR